MSIKNLTGNGILEKLEASNPDFLSKIDIGNSAPVTNMSSGFNMSANPSLATNTFDISMEAAL